MGLLDFFKSKDQPSTAITFPAMLGAPASGTVIAMKDIPDEVFSTGVLGTCCGVDPVEGKVYAPTSGKITQLADTLHAIGIEASGIEILIHVGVDTVEMEGKGFSSKVKLGGTVKKGDLLLTMDLNAIQAAGHPSTVIMAITNSDDFASVEMAAKDMVQAGNDMLMISK